MTDPKQAPRATGRVEALGAGQPTGSAEYAGPARAEVCDLCGLAQRGSTMPDEPCATAAPVLRLYAESLFSKWGFSDGDCPEELYDWCDEQGIDYTGWDWKSMLARMVRERLVPALDATVEVVEIGTSHNPIRASKVNGEDVEHYWYGDNDPVPALSPDHVSIPYDEVVRYAQ